MAKNKHSDTSSCMILIFSINDINIHDINFVIKKLFYEKLALAESKDQKQKLFYEKLALAESKDQKPPVLTELSLKLHQ